ncbi:hypothetical protein [Rhabdothermincola sp.]|uniref:hypothetical protein n=1 Tax=Rhabdothermincola sp. TaxID=2820405 RepID=UPI002FE39058
MKRSLAAMAVLIVLAASGVGLASSAGAAVNTYSGVLDNSDPTMPVVPLILTPNCTGGTTPISVHYEVIPFTNAVGGTYTFVQYPSTAEIALYVMEGSFDPDDPVPTCVAASNTNPINLSFEFTAGTDYYVVIIDDTFAQPGGTWELQVTQPDPPTTTTSTSTTTTSAPTTTTTAPASTSTTAQPAAARVALPRFTG